MPSPSVRLWQNPQSANRLLESIRHGMTLYGYQLIETPVIEPADLFLTRAGDQLINRLFTFERQGQQLALRPEFTAAAAHRYAQLGQREIVRWQFSGLIFEDEPDSVIKDYQQLSAGAELIGMDGPTADAEIISLAVDGIAAQNVSGWKLTIGHTGLLRLLLSRYQLDNRIEQFLLSRSTGLHDTRRGKAAILDEFDRTLLAVTPEAGAQFADSDDASLSLAEINTHQMLGVLLDATHRGMTMGGRTRHDIARRLLQKRQRFTERHQVIAALDFLEEWTAIRAPVEDGFAALSRLIPQDDETAKDLLHKWQETMTLLQVSGIDLDRITLQPHVARNWDYYTGIVFELMVEPDVRLGGGGRYNELVSLVGGQSVPAVGFAYYLDPIMSHLPDKPLNPVQPISIVVEPADQPAGIRLAQVLRSQEIPAVVVLDHEADPHKQTIYVNSDGRIRWNENDYTLDNPDTLIADIRQVIHV